MPVSGKIRGTTKPSTKQYSNSIITPATSTLRSIVSSLGADQDLRTRRFKHPLLRCRIKSVWTILARRGEIKAAKKSLLTTKCPSVPTTAREHRPDDELLVAQMSFCRVSVIFVLEMLLPGLPVSVQALQATPIHIVFSCDARPGLWRCTSILKFAVLDWQMRHNRSQPCWQS